MHTLKSSCLSSCVRKAVVLIILGVNINLALAIKTFASPVNEGEQERYFQTNEDETNLQSGEDEISSLYVRKKPFSVNYDESGNDDAIGRNGRMGSDADNKDNKERLAMLKQIKSMDHMKCFPKVLCGLSVDSSKNSKSIDSTFVRSYIQLMRSTNPEDDSSEATRPSSDKTKDALSLFLLRSGLLKPKQSQSASSSEEEEEDPASEEKHKSRLHKKMLHVNAGSDQQMKHDPDPKDSSSISSQIGSLVSSWVPWLSLSFTNDSFETDPFFKGGSPQSKKQPSQKSKEQWEKDLEQLALLLRLREAEIKRKKARAKGKAGQRNPKMQLQEYDAKSFRDLSILDDEIQVYSTAVEIGKKLKDTRQCDYLYNGCPVPYKNILKIIASIRKELKQSDETVEGLSKEILDYLPSSKKKNNNKKPNNSKPQVQAQKPMTQISHTLANGEKVEINVQLSAKEGGTSTELEIESPYDEYVPQEAIKDASEEQAPTNGDHEEPAISASYELDDEKLGEDHRKPSPLDIFNKVNSKTRRTTTTTLRPSTTKYTIAKRQPSTGKPKYTTKPKTPPAATTKKPPTKRPTGLRPRWTIRPGEKVQTEEALAVITTTTKRPRIQTTKGYAILKHANSTTVTNPLESKSPIKNKPKETIDDDEFDSDFISTKFQKNTVKEFRVTTPRTTTTTTEEPPIVIEEDETEGQSPANQLETLIPDDETTSEEEIVSEVESSTTQPPKITSTKPAPTLPALAFFTQSYMDEVMADIYRPKNTAAGNNKPSSSGGYSVNKKRRPGNCNHSSSPPQLSPHKGHEPSYVTSVESGEVRPVQSSSGMMSSGEQMEEIGESGKKRIKYKNPKRPYLVLMTTTTTRSPQNKRKRRPSTNPNSSGTTATLTASKSQSHPFVPSGEAPLVLEPGSFDHTYQYSPSLL